MAPGNEATRAKLTNESRRLSAARRGLDEDILQMQPHVPFHLDEDKFQHNMRTSRRGAAGGPSGMTAEHLRVLLDSPSCTSLLGEAASQLAEGNIPEEVVTAIRLGRMTALQKPDGGVRGIVVGDVFRRVVARTIAQQYAKLGEAATHPFQHALSTRAGTECVTHIVQAMTSEDREATILSIDGIGACDLVSRNAMFRGVADMVDGDKLVPFMRLFHGSPSTFLWEDDEGTVHHVRQGEGGEQGDPLMHLLFSLGLHRALVSVKSQLEDGEKFFAFLDDVYVICRPTRVLQVFRLLEHELGRKACICVHQGKTRFGIEEGSRQQG